MAIGTPFHPRTDPLCRSRRWRQWSGYFAATSYGDYVQPEYAAIRHAAALIDVSPLYKYLVEGPDAEACLDRIVTQDLTRLPVGGVAYTPWCDADGSVRQDGTVFRLDQDRFQVNAAEPALAWFEQNATGFDARVIDRSTALAALSLQGPHSRRTLELASTAGVTDLPFFRLTAGEIAGAPVTISRTGYTGDLGFEIWMAAGDALRVWDALMEAGAPYHVTPCGMAAMDIARLETGFVLINVDYVSAEIAVADEDKATPYELGMGWTVKLDKPHFVGRPALRAERRRGSARNLVGLEVPWGPVERAYMAAGRMPDLPLEPDRNPVPVYAANRSTQVGRATTRVWSTLLKRFIALATLDASFAAPGTTVDLEMTVAYRRTRVPATVVKPPFHRLDRMRA